MKCTVRILLIFAFLAFAAPQKVSAAQFSIDEYGHMTVNDINAPPGILGPDPTGGLLNWSVLIYTLPFAGTRGDVLIHDPFESGSPILDVIRFDGTNHMIFYSDSIDGFTAPADTPGPPDPFLPLTIHIDEQGDEVFSWARYTPLPGQPGYDASNPRYFFVSDGTVPEPSTGGLLLIAVGAFALRRHGSQNSSN